MKRFKIMRFKKIVQQNRFKKTVSGVALKPMKLSPPNGAQGQIDNPWRILETIFLKRFS